MKFYKGPAWKWWLFYRWMGYDRLVIREIDIPSRPLKAGWRVETKPDILCPDCFPEGVICPDPLCNCSRPK